MKSLSDEYLELASLTREHLTNDFSPQERLLVDGETYAFFRQQAQQQMQQQKKAPLPTAPQPAVAKPAAPPTYTPPPPPQIIAKPVAPNPTPIETPKPAPKIETPETPKTEQEVKKPFFVLEPMPKAAVVDLGAVGKTFESLFPQLYVSEVPKVKTESHLTFSIINMETSAEKRAFLNQFGRALFTVFGQVKMISPDQVSSAQGILIAPRSFEEKVKEYNGKVLYLDEIDLYLKEPARKAVLWDAVKSLCTQ